MAKVFAENKGKSPRSLRNGYDHSFQNLLTGDYGYIYPINVEELNPGESIRIVDTVSVRSHPVVFPVQTRIKAYVHYFAVRNRILLNDWENFISGLDPNAHLPFLKWTESQGQRFLKTGSLMDYLGVPTTVAGEHPVRLPVIVSDLFNFLSKVSSTNFNVFSTYDAYVTSSLVNFKFLVNVQNAIFPSIPSNQIFGLGRTYRFDEQVSFLPDELFSPSFGLVSSPTTPTCIFVYVDGEFQHHYSPTISATDDGGVSITIDSDTKDLFLNSKSLGVDFVLLHWYAPLGSNSVDITGVSAYNSFVIPYFGRLGSLSQSSYLSNLFSYFTIDGVIDAVDDRVISENRFLSHSGQDPQEPLSALYPRAYEMIYNYYYRNSQNNPYNPTGSKVEYNKFIPTDESGWDTNEYQLRRRNWELDPYTSAVPSPQFGDAPLIGITYTGGDTADFTFEVQDDQQNTVKVKAKMRVDPDTGVLSGVQSFDENVPSGNIRNLMDLSTYGISINAIRNANAFQLFKEDTLQHPLRYRDQIYAHFGVNVDYPDVDVPEFIGGTSADLVVSQVTNMSESDNAPLGDIAGKIDAVFQFKHPVKYHAKEHTIIIGVISLVPVPCYSQLLPKRFSRVSMFDFYQRRFGKIGYVPIFRRELFPLQSQDPDEVFGYQRAWYEYMSRQNEIHGDFRTSLSDFVITRVFKDEPQLNENFTVVDPDSVTNIFATDGIQDKYGSSNKFMIQVYHDTSYISIIPKHGRAALE